MDYSAYKGDTKQVQVTFTDADTGSALDITTGTAVFRLSLDGTVLTTKTNAPGGHSVPASGQTVFSLSAAELGIDPGVYVWYCTLTLSGAVRTVESGTFTILPR